MCPTSHFARLVRKGAMEGLSPKISIITPVFNPGDLLSGCLASLEGQTIFSLMEVVLVDDGSTDGSGELCDRYAERHANVKVFHQPNRGQAAARNVAIDAASGDYVLLVDSDDAISSDACERLLAAAEESGADVVWGDYAGASLFKGEVAKLAGQGLVPMDRYLRCALHEGLFVITPCVQLVRTSFLREHGVAFREGRIFEDQLWLLELMLARPTMLRLDFAFYTYNICDHPSSTTVVTAKRLMDAIDVIYAMIDATERAQPDDEVREVAEAFIANSIFVLAHTFICHAPAEVQRLVLLRVDERYARYARKTQLLPKIARTLGPSLAAGQEEFEEELRRYREARAAQLATRAQ